MKPSKLMLLHPEDNVLVCIAPLAAAEPIVIDEVELCAPQHVDVGHKVARRPIAAGEKVLKYGAPIGSAMREIAPGEWVHMHNMRSDYISTNDRRSSAGDTA